MLTVPGYRSESENETRRLSSLVFDIEDDEANHKTIRANTFQKRRSSHLAFARKNLSDIGRAKSLSSSTSRNKRSITKSSSPNFLEVPGDHSRPSTLSLRRATILMRQVSFEEASSSDDSGEHFGTEAEEPLLPIHERDVPIENSPPKETILEIPVTKAAAISSAMLTRKQSLHGASVAGAPGTGGGTSLHGGGDSLPGDSFQQDMRATADRVGFAAGTRDEDGKEHMDVQWYNREWIKRLLMYSALLSLFSISLNTPDTFKKMPELKFVTFGVDIFVTIFFTAEAMAKMNHRGFRKESYSYMRDRWCQFDFFIMVCHWISVIIQTFEIAKDYYPHVLSISWLSVFRSPRPLISFRFVRSAFQFQLPKHRLNQIFKRSSQQIYNVTVFFLFFMALYGILGVQFFGHMDYHCIKKGADEKNITIRDLAIPDTYCSPHPGAGYQCPDNMNCQKLVLKASQEGYYGMFNNIANSIFTVYMAASQEGWVYVMYDCIDSLPSWKAFFYFTTLIFFLAWLVKNVFIAVITETFAEIRVQFSQMWGNREIMTEDEFRQVLEKTENGGWRLVTIDSNKSTGLAPKFMQNFFKSTIFQVFVMILVISNAVINASIVHKHDGKIEEQLMTYYICEVIFTVIFNVECIFKILCIGWSAYIRRGIHKFEFILCLGSTLNIIKPIYDQKICAYFQVFRVMRLIKASPMLEDFVYKIFGPGKKLGGLIAFTMALLIITSAISLQLFCFVQGLERFRTFPEALMSMFQILTQEGWTEVVVESMRMTGDTLAPVVAIYFVVYHLFVTLIVLSLFVAVILDNLEMEEDMKKIKQLKAREQTERARSQLPLRLRVFTRFPDRPQLVIVKRVPSEFPTPRIRDTFTRQFADEEDDEQNDTQIPGGGKSQLERSRLNKIRRRLRARHIGQLSSRTGVTYIVEKSNKMRMLLSDSVGIIPMIGRFGTSIRHRDKKKLTQQRSIMAGSVKLKQMFEHHLKENGDLSRPAVTGNATGSSRRKANLGSHNKEEIDIKAFQQKKHQAEMTRTRLEEEMRENHPMFDKPLFAVGRESRFRKICQTIVFAKYTPVRTDPLTGKAIQRNYKELQLVNVIKQINRSTTIVFQL